MSPLGEAIRTKAEAGEPPWTAHRQVWSRIALIGNISVYLEWGCGGEDAGGGTRGNREFTGESMPWVGRDFSHSRAEVLWVQALARLLINHVTWTNHCQCQASVSLFIVFNAHSSVSECTFQ